MTALTGDCDSDDDGSDSEAAAECVRLALRALSGDDLLEWVGVEAGGRIWPNGGVARVGRSDPGPLSRARDEARRKGDCEAEDEPEECGIGE